MADNPSSSTDPSENLPKGMRVVRKRRKRGNRSRQTLFLKKREILREMTSEEEGGAISVKDQLSRLKSAKKAQKEDKPVDERWGNAESGQRGARILLWSLAIVVPVLAIITAFVLTRGEEGNTNAENQLNFSFNISDEKDFELIGPRAWFEENPHHAYVSSIQILERLNQSAEGVVPDSVFRRENFALREIAARGIGWLSHFVTGDPRTFRWSIADTENVGFLVLEGLREDQSTFRSYFVKSSEGIRMDWAASTAWCEVPPDELRTVVADRNVQVRCILEKQPHFDSQADEKRSWFLMTLPGSEEPLWGFAPAGSPLDEELLDLFHFGRFILERKDDVRAIARIGRTDAGLKENQVEILDLVTEEWVEP